MAPHVTPLDPPALRAHLADLSRLLVDCVADGAAISFLAPLARSDADRFWLDIVAPDIAAGRRTLLAAWRDGQVVGSVQLVTAMPPNQPHRCEVAKMMVHPQARRAGIGRALMLHALAVARDAGKTLVTLDTRTGDVAQSLYAGLGFEQAGIIPDYALDPDGRALHGTTFMFCRL